MKNGKEKYGKYYRGDGNFHLNFIGLESGAVGALSLKRLEESVEAFHRGDENFENVFKALRDFRKRINESLEMTESHVLFLIFDAEEAVIKENEEIKRYEEFKKTGKYSPRKELDNE